MSDTFKTGDRVLVKPNELGGCLPDEGIPGTVDAPVRWGRYVVVDRPCKCGIDRFWLGLDDMTGDDVTVEVIREGEA